MYVISCFTRPEENNYLEDLDVDNRAINLLMGLRSIMRDGVAQDKDMCRSLVETVINLHDCVFNCVHVIGRVSTLLTQTVTNIQFLQKVWNLLT